MTTHRRRLLCSFVAALAALVALPWGIAARAQDIPAPLRAALVLRAVGYERTINTGRGSLRLVVVGAAGSSDAADMQSAFEGLAPRMQVAGRTVVVSRIEHQSVAETLAEIRRTGATIVYVASDVEGVVGSMANVLGSERRLLVCGRPRLVGSGCILSIEPAGGRSRLVIDLARASAQGFEFDSRLVRLSRVVR